MKNIKVIAADIDNTLIQKYQPMSEYERDIIMEARSQGILFGIASGRDLAMCQSLVEQWGIEADFYICANGYELYDSLTQTSIFGEKMKSEWCKEVIDFLQPYDPTISFHKDGKTFSNRVDQYFGQPGPKYHYDNCIVEDAAFFYQPVVKLMFRMDPEKVNEAQAKAKLLPSRKYKIFRTQPILLEACATSVSKGNALAKYCTLKGIDIQEACAFGDTENDEDMLEIAGLGVCMANGDASTKRIADVITEYDCAHDGVGRFIEEYILHN